MAENRRHEEYLRSMRSRFLLLGALLLIQHADFWCQRMPMADQLALNELTTIVDKHLDQNTLQDHVGGFPVAWIQHRPTVGFVGRLNPGVSCEGWRNWVAEHPFVLAGACRDGIASFRVDAAHLDVLENLPMALVHLASRAVPSLNNTRYGTRVDSVHVGYNLPMPFHGEGVMIGVLDWGFDYTHPMFYDSSLTDLRIHAVWDQYRQSGPPPAGFNYGAATADPSVMQGWGSDTSNVYGYSTHGTHVAGIAGGAGAGVGLTGMAPAATFLFATLMVDEAAALDAFAWMQEIAEFEGKRLVINNSWGLPQWGTPDGTGLSNQFMDAMSAEGVIFVSSNGNNGDSDFHISHEFQGDTVHSRVQFYPLSANPNAWGQNLTLWGEPGTSFQASFLLTQGVSNVVASSPIFNTADGPLMLDAEMTVNGDAIVYDVAMEAEHPANGRPFLQIKVRKGNSPLGVVLQIAAEDGLVHAWNHTHLTNDVGNWGQDFQAAQSTWLAGDPSYGIQQPACGQTVIAIGAYSSEFQNGQGNESGGFLANFSSHGPTLDGRLKPNVSAPGVQVESALSSFRDIQGSVTNSVVFGDGDYDFGKLSGTSMSGPAAAGVVALMLEANPNLQPQDVLQILESTARTDDQTGPIEATGDIVWGHGKVNAMQAVWASLNWVSGVGLAEDRTSDDAQWLVYPNPTTDAIWVRPHDNVHWKWQVLDAYGRLCLQGRNAGCFGINLDGLPSGHYVLRASNGRGDVRCTPMIKQL